MNLTVVDNGCYVRAATNRSPAIFAVAVVPFDSVDSIPVRLILHIDSIRLSLHVSRSYVKADDGGCLLDKAHCDFIVGIQELSQIRACLTELIWAGCHHE